ncbi:30S ribosomal protein S4e [Acidianus sulfidivorans JP7]|uniref:Small ribosomal subunit protein eS4 n=1 Tax=Acidianus sulfidivorans JP7 TaxID=619593 RepID=A0A2U9IMR8_9CREN|nr:30S ribosomal protein S4e [Acidianus sulfidivorans]AWR97295.1 30S ribosomal protein S4e [Acidianus sulfidivorans JP7]
MPHITRTESPWFLKISKKEYKWTVRSNPGPHALTRSIPLALILRDYLNFALNLRESKKIIDEGKVFVDGVIRRDYRYPVGLMDIVSIPSSNLYYLMAPDRARFIVPIPISEEDSKFKLVRIMNKTVVKGGNIQLNLEDGRNILVNAEESKKYSTLSTVKITIPSQSIVNVYPMNENMYGIIIGGKNIGVHGKIVKIKRSQYKVRKYSIVSIQKQNEIYETNLENVMVIGEEKPEIKVE